jgi:hypothetical protein
LRADAKFPAASVSIFDGHYGVIAEGTGCVEADVVAGLYIVQFKAGQLFEKQPVDVSADTAVEAKTFSVIASPSQKLPLSASSNSGQCRVYLRAEGDCGEAFLKNMSIHDASRESVAPTVQSESLRFVGERSLSLKPGQYLLRVEIEPGKSFEQTVFIPAGWQLQIFFRTDGGSIRESDVCRWMTNAAILLLPENFDFVSSDHDREAIEIALQNLTSNSPLTPAARANKGQPSSNPMLDIIVAHQLLREHTSDPAAFDNAVRALGAMIPVHPDVMSLKLRTASANPTTLAFDFPPMLRNSWRILVEQSMNTPAIIPANSWAALAAFGMTGVRGWLVWRTPDAGQTLLVPSTVRGDSLDDIRAKISALVTGKTEVEMRKLVKDLDLNGVEGPLLTYLIGVVRTEDTAQKLVQSLYSSDAVSSIYRFFRRFLPNVNLVPKEKIIETATKFIQTRSSEAYVIRSLEIPQVTLMSALASLGPKLVARLPLPQSKSSIPSGPG